MAAVAAAGVLLVALGRRRGAAVPVRTRVHPGSPPVRKQ
jgi:hypothetical protein